MDEIFVEDCTLLSDDTLVVYIRNGEYRYLEVLAERYKSMIFGIALEYVSDSFELDDLVQEGNIAFFSAVQSYKQGLSSFRTFANLCVTRAILSHTRSSNVSKRIPSNLITSIDDTDFSVDESPENIIIEKEKYKNLTNRIKFTLSDLEYKVLCEFLMGYSYADIALRLGISEKSVDNALRRVREKIKS